MLDAIQEKLQEELTRGQAAIDSLTEQLEDAKTQLETIRTEAARLIDSAESTPTVAKERLEELVQNVSQQLEATRVAAESALGRAANTPALIQTEADKALTKLASLLKKLQAQGDKTLWNAHISALELGRGVAEGLEEQKMAGLKTQVESFLNNLETKTLNPRIADYDELNVREIRARLPDLSRYDLFRVGRYEAAHKNRKTVIDEVKRGVARRARF